jgi:predicted patatin/cPLA2 family phospholipase
MYVFTFFNNQNEDRKFFITVTNASTGKAEYIHSQNPEETLTWIEASSSLPIVGRAVKINNQDWFDGGITDSIPILQAEKDGNFIIK